MFCNQLLTSLFSFHSRSRVQQSDNSCDKQLVAIDHDYCIMIMKKLLRFRFLFFLISIIIVTPILMFSYLNRIYIFYA